MDEDPGLSPLELEPYWSSNIINVEPGIRLSWSSDHEIVYFEVEWNGNNFITYVDISELSKFPEIKTALSDIGFSENETGNRLEREDKSAELLDVILDVSRVIAEKSG